jgi:hypothetical protein
MSEKEEKPWLYYEFDEFRKQMAEATATLKKMNEAAVAMRWQYETDEDWEEFVKEMSIAEGWLSSWCG